MRRLTGAALVALIALLVVGSVPALGFDRAANEATMLRLINHARTSRGLRGRQDRGRRSTGRRSRTPGT